MALKIIDDWRAHASAEPAWEAICEAAQRNRTAPPPPAFLIAWVVRTRIEYERVIRGEKEFRSVARSLNAQADRDWREGRIDDAYLKKSAVLKSADQVADVFGRKKNTAMRVRFTKMVRDMFQENCGQPLDEVAAMIVSVAFDAEVSVDAVRSTIKARKAKDRGIRSPK